MVEAALLQTGATRAVAAAGLSLVLWSFATKPAEARQTAQQEPTTPEAVTPPIDLIGPWLRNDELSKAPSLNGESIRQGPEQVAALFSDLADSLSDRLDAILIEVDGNTLLLLNAKGELSSFRLGREQYSDRVDFYLNDRPVTAVEDFRDPDDDAGRFVSVDASIQDVRVNDFVRVTARLADGSELEDAELLGGANYQSEIDAQLVQFQILVVDRQGNPVGTLQPDDFSIHENRRPRKVENIHTAVDVPLVLGLAIDSSDSMLPIWRNLKQLVMRFLDRSLTSGNRAFLVDFDKTVQLLQPLTDNRALLSAWLDRVTPLGGTALNDGVLFSLLQYRSEPGRRALVVITDGADLHSRSRLRQSADFAERLGVPIYFVELDNRITEVSVGGGGIAPSTVAPRLRQQEARKRLQRISRRTGGQLFHIPPFADGAERAKRIEQVFDGIEADLRHQHVLTYYSDRPLGARIKPDIEVTRRGLKLHSAVPLQAIE